MRKRSKLLNNKLFNKFFFLLTSYLFTALSTVSPAYGKTFFEGLFDDIITPPELGLIIALIIALILTPAGIRIKILGVAVGLIMVYIMLISFNIMTRVS